MSHDRLTCLSMSNTETVSWLDGLSRGQLTSLSEISVLDQQGNGVLISVRFQALCCGTSLDTGNRHHLYFFLIKLIIRPVSGDSEPSLSCSEKGLGCWRLPIMHWVFLLKLPFHTLCLSVVIIDLRLSSKMWSLSCHPVQGFGRRDGVDVSDWF